MQRRWGASRTTSGRARPCLLSRGEVLSERGLRRLSHSPMRFLPSCRRKSTNALSARLFPPSMPSFPRVLYASDMGMRTRGVKCRAILSSRRRNESELYQLQELVLKCPRLRYAPPAAILHGTHCARGAYKSKTCACRLAFRGAVRCGAYLCRGGWVGRAPGGSPSTFPLRGRTKTSC